MLALIAAVGLDRVIGKNNAMPWHSAADMRRFRELTMGGVLIMGRKTHDSIGRALPGRRNIVVSRNRGYSSPECEIVGSIPAAFAAAAGDLPVFVIGGEQIYRQTLSLADCLYITKVGKNTPDGDAFFPADFDASRRTVQQQGPLFSDFDASRRAAQQWDVPLFSDFDESEWTVRRETRSAENPPIVFETYTKRVGG